MTLSFVTYFMNRTVVYLLALIGAVGCTTTDAQEVIKNTSRCSHMSVEEHNANLILPYYRPAPSYPLEAAKNNVEGYVTFEFDLSISGQPINITVLDSSPSDLFVSAAKYNLRGYRYKPKLTDGKSVVSECHTARIVFENGD